MDASVCAGVWFCTMQKNNHIVVVYDVVDYLLSEYVHLSFAIIIAFSLNYKKTNCVFNKGIMQLDFSKTSLAFKTRIFSFVFVYIFQNNEMFGYSS